MRENIHTISYVVTGYTFGYKGIEEPHATKAYAYDDGMLALSFMRDMSANLRRLNIRHCFTTTRVEQTWKWDDEGMYQGTSETYIVETVEG